MPSVQVTAAAAGTTANAIPAVAGSVIKVTGIALTNATAGTVKLQSHTTTANATAAWNVPTSGLVMPFDQDGWFSSTAGEGVDVVFATGTNLAATLTYEVIASNLYITEFQTNLQTEWMVPPNEVPLAQQTIAVGPASAQSAAFQPNTNLVRLNNDTGGACCVQFGTNPTATTTTMRIGPNSEEYVRVPPGQSFKVAAISVGA